MVRAWLSCVVEEVQCSINTPKHPLMYRHALKFVIDQWFWAVCLTNHFTTILLVWSQLACAVKQKSLVFTLLHMYCTPSLTCTGVIRCKICHLFWKFLACLFSFSCMCDPGMSPPPPQPIIPLLLCGGYTCYYKAWAYAHLHGQNKRGLILLLLE